MPARPEATVGVADHAGWAVWVTVADGAVVDRRRVELLDDGLPALAHHHEAQRLPLPEAVALIARVRASAVRCATRELDALAAAVPALGAIALRAIPEKMPARVEARITDYWAQNRADQVMLREVLAEVAEGRGWDVSWYAPKVVMARDGVEALVREVGRELGPPWRKDHRVAMAAALAARRGA